MKSRPASGGWATVQISVRTSLPLAFALSLATLTTACDTQETSPPPAPEPASVVTVAPLTAADTVVLNGLIDASIQIDQLDETGPGDANLFVGADPADGTASVDRPFGASPPFIDWEDLGDDLANHRILDLDGPSGKDPTAFPRSNECVGPAQVLSKMDLTYIASANTTQYAYIGVQRAANNGDAGYYWIFTRKAPQLNTGEAPCRADEQRMVYDISGPDGDGQGDVLVLGHFHPSDGPLVQVFVATTSRDHVTAVDAINYLDTTLWQERTSAVAAAAVNTTPTAPGAFGAAGVKSITKGELDTELFAEAAIGLDTFTGGDLCGKTFFGTVVTRSSGSGGTTPDLKDTSAPALFNFGRTDVQPTITTACTSSVGLAVAVTGPNGRPIENPVCTWEFSNGVTFEGCDGSVDLGAAGDYTATVTVVDDLLGCTTTSAELSVTVHPPFSVTASLDPVCDGVIDYAATVSGADPAAVDFAWTFTSDAGDAQEATDASGSFVGAPAAAYTGDVVATFLRDDGLACEATASASTTAPAPLSATAHIGATCDLAYTYAVTGIVGGADPAAVECAWTFDDGSTATGCDGSATVAGAGSYGGTVVLTDPATGCSGTATADAAILYPPLAVTADLTDGCDATVGYSGVVTGGYPGGRTVAWAFSPDSASPATSDQLAGVFSGAPLTAYTGSLTATDARPDGLVCTASDASEATALSPMDASPGLIPQCGQSFAFAAGAVTGPDGGTLAAATCHWSFDDGTTSDDCGGDHATAAPGRYAATLTVTDPATGCSAARGAGPVDVWAPLAASATLTPETCTPTFGYAATVSGGSTAGVSYAWTFAPDDASPAASDAASGTVDGAELTTYTAQLTVTDLRTDLAGCTANASGSAQTAAITRATAALSPTCDQAFGFAVTSATGADGEAIADPGCAWTFSDGGAAAVCAGQHAVAAPGAGFTGAVVVTDPASGCTAAVDGGAADAWASLGATADLSARCDEAFDFAGAATGGSPAGVDWAWTFSPDSAAPTTSSASSGTVTGVADVTYTGAATVTDRRADGVTCTASADDSATPRAPLAVNLVPAASAPSCPGMSSDGVTYDAVPTGGSGSYAFAWDGPAGCAGASCSFDPPDDAFCVTQTFQVTLSDDEGLCPAATSEVETYRKVTQIDVSDD